MKIKSLLVLTFLTSFYSGCQNNLTGPEIPVLKNWHGQVVSEFVYAILKPDSTVQTWGNNYFGTLGNGTNNSSKYPVQVLNLKNIISIDFFWGAAFAADKDGNIWFWGNYGTYLGPPDIDTNVTTPIKVAFLKNIKSISVWNLKVQLLTKDGHVWFMYMDQYSTHVNSGPTQYAGIDEIISIHKFLALRKDGKIFSLGTNDNPDNLAGNVIMIQSTQFRQVFLKDDGTVWAEGKNDLGQLGNGTFNDSSELTKVINLNNIIAISSNYDYNLALKKDGTIWFWGFEKQEGDSLIGRNIPLKIDGLEDIVLIYTGPECLVMKKDGTYWTFSASDKISKQVQLY